MSRYFVFWYSKDDVKLFWSVELRWVMWSPGLLFWYFFFLGNVWNSCLLHNYFRCTYFTILSSFKDKLPTHIMKIYLGDLLKINGSKRHGTVWSKVSLSHFRFLVYVLQFRVVKGYSVDAAPLDPTLKLSIKRTVLLSNGTVVPPLWK